MLAPVALAGSGRSGPATVSVAKVATGLASSLMRTTRAVVKQRGGRLPNARTSSISRLRRPRSHHRERGEGQRTPPQLANANHERLSRRAPPERPSVDPPAIQTERPLRPKHLLGGDGAELASVGKHRAQHRCARGEPGDEALGVVADHRDRAHGFRPDGAGNDAPVAPHDRRPGRPEGRTARGPHRTDQADAEPASRRRTVWSTPPLRR